MTEKTVNIIMKRIKKAKLFSGSNTLASIRISAGNAAFRMITSAVPFALAAAVTFSHIPEAENRLSSVIEPNVSSQTWGYIRYVMSLAFEKATFPVFSIGMLTLLFTVSAAVNALIKGISDSGESRIGDRVKSVLVSILILLEGTVLISAAEGIESIKRTQVLLWVLSFAALAFILYVLYVISGREKTKSKEAAVKAISASAMILLLTHGMRLYYSAAVHPENLYGSLGGLLIIFSWIYLVGFAVIAVGRISL